MQLPALMYKSLRYAKEIATDDELFKKLVEKPPDLIKFLVKACDDETWALNHPAFMKQGIAWVTEQFFQDRLMMDFAQRVAKMLREHNSALEEFIPKNLTIKLKETDVQINSLLFGSASEFLREMVRRECRDRKRTVLQLKEISYQRFELVEEYVNTGLTLELVRKEKGMVVKILNLAMQWELDDLSIACQDMLKNYLTSENVFDTMIRAHVKRRLHLRAACYDFVNQYKLGYRFEDRGPDYMAFEFLEFTENSWEAFEKVRPYITHLICGGRTTEEADFVKALHACPKLLCLDISRSATFSDYLLEIPSTLEELEASSCPWMNNANLTRLLEVCVQLSRLSLVSDVDITAEGWSALQKLERLRNLDLTRCSQVGDDELRLLLQACKGLIILSLEECRRLSDGGFIDIPKYNPGLTVLNLARTQISDLPLIDIATNSRFLNKINISRCEFITEGGVLELLRNARELREVNIVHCDISKEGVAALRKRFPYVKIISE